MPLLSHASDGLGQAREVTHLLGRLAGEQLEQLLDVEPSRHLHAAQGGGGAGLRLVVAHEPQRLPVGVGQLVDPDQLGQNLGEGLAPLVAVGEEPLVV